MNSNHFNTTKFTTILLHLLLLLLSTATTTGTTKHPKISDIIPGKPLISHNATLSFEGNLNPSIVHSHNVKMKWSKPRNYDDLGRRKLHNPPPSLAHTITVRLSGQVFTSLASRLPYDHAKRVFDTKANNQFRDLQPVCVVSRPGGGAGGAGKQPTTTTTTTTDQEQRFNDGISSSSPDDTESLSTEDLLLLQQQQETIESCRVDFTSLRSSYGIRFDFRLVFHNKPMTDLSPQDIAVRITPDHRGWTQPIVNSDISLSVGLSSPDFVPYRVPNDGRVRMAGNGNVPLDRLIVDRRNVEEAIETLLKKSMVVMGLVDVKNLYKSRVDQSVVVPTGLFDGKELEDDDDGLRKDGSGEENNNHSDSGDDLKVDGSSTLTSSEEEVVIEETLLPPDILHLCQKYNLNEEDCRNEIINFEAEENQSRPNNNMEDSDSESNTNTHDHHTNLDDMNQLDMIRLMDTSTESDTILDHKNEWDIPMEDLIQLRNDLIDIEKLVDDTIE